MYNKQKHNYFKKIITGIIAGIFCSLFSGTTTFAKDSGQDVDFNIQAILPGNQSDPNNTYFDLKMEPGQKQTVEFMLNNTGDKETTYTISINQAYTNAQGFIDYNDKNAELDDSLKYPIDELVTYDKEVTVPAKTSKKIPIVIQMPKESFDGQIMAGIQVTKKQSDTDQASISNKIGYILGLNLHETESEVKRDIKLISVKPAAFNGSTSVQVKLKNPTMEAIGHLKYVVNITDKKTNKNIRSVTYDSDMQMAPNSTYDFSVEWEGKRLVAGDYVLDLVITDAKGNKWKINKDFAITAKEAKDINDATVDFSAKKSLSIWIIVLISSIVLILLVLGIIWFVKRKKRKEIERKREHNRKKKTAKQKEAVSKSKMKSMKNKKKSRDKI